MNHCIYYLLWWCIIRFIKNVYEHLLDNLILLFRLGVDVVLFYNMFIQQEQIYYFVSANAPVFWPFYNSNCYEHGLWGYLSYAVSLQHIVHCAKVISAHNPHPLKAKCTFSDLYIYIYIYWGAVLLGIIALYYWWCIMRFIQNISEYCTW